MYEKSKIHRTAIKNKNPNSGSGNYYLKLKIKALQIDTSHFKGQGWCIGQNHDKHIKNFVKIPLDKILIKNSTYLSTSNLKIRLLKENLLENKCNICGQLPIWNNSPLILQIDHIDGDRTNNKIENLRIVCPNCHTQTKTFCAKNRKPKTQKCLHCQKLINLKRKFCSVDCSNRHNFKDIPKPTKIQWPDHDILKQMVNESSYLQVGKHLGVSDNAVRKRLKNHSWPHFTPF